MNKYPGKHGKEVYKQLENVCRFGYQFSSVFSDFVETVLNALLSLTDNMQYADVANRLVDNRLTGTYEDRYMQLIHKYKENKDRVQGERPADFFASAWGALQIATAKANEDVLGEIYEVCISNGEHGQFFTPPDLCNMMAQLVGSNEGETVSDPACGSGRLFISQAKVQTGLHFVGVDIAPTIARMCVLNMWLFNLHADIYEGNSLSMEMRYLWHIRPGGLIFEAKIDHSQKVVPAIVEDERSVA